MPNGKHSVFVAGGTGYLGRPLIERLLQRGNGVRALVRPGSEGKLPPACEVIPGNTLAPATYASQIATSDTFVQLVGVAHPSPAKAAQFRSIDLVSARGAIGAAADAKVQHFVYLSVAHPAPMMKAYIAVRAECEELLRESGLNATILRPWYVLGPGHRWPYLILPGYWLFGLLPATREGARRLGLVTRVQMIAAMVNAVESPPEGVHVVEVPEIRAARGLQG